jgi:acetyltransferase-like isoleucine patch superfamily enzyme
MSYAIMHEKEIPYFEETTHRSFRQRLRKIKNTILLLLAYACPSSKLRIILHRMRGVHIGSNCYIGLFCFIDNLYPDYVYLEDNASLNTGSMIIAHFNPPLRFKRIFKASVAPVIIKNGALVAINYIILPGVTIGNNSIVSAGSVVTDNVEDCVLVRGNPAKKVAKIKL